MAALDPVFARGMKLLLSDEPDSTEQLREMLDEALRHKYGTGLPKQMPGESPAPARLVIKGERKSVDSTSTSSRGATPPASLYSDESNEPSGNVEDSFSMHLTDLTCVICGQMNVSARNQLMECHDCSRLYHQDCHDPPVAELNDTSTPWSCVECINKKLAKIKEEFKMKKERHMSTSGSSSSGNGSSHKKSSKSGSSSSSHKPSSKSSSGSHSESKRHSYSSNAPSSSSSHHKSSSSKSSSKSSSRHSH